MKKIHEILNKQYYKKSSWIFILIPLSFIYFIIIFCRSLAYKTGILKSIKLDVPVVIVGNITIGGTGKTPLVIWLLEKLMKIGKKPGLICSGYNSYTKSPQEVSVDSEVSNVGDEALMIKLHFQKRHNIDIPVFVGKKKVQVGQMLLKSYPDIDILISDDGLQHYELKRDFEIAVVDGDRKFGNGFLLPAGPLREFTNRLSTIDALVINGSTENMLAEKKILIYKMSCFGGILENCLHNNRVSNLDAIEGDIVAITGIGNPERFFEQLKAAGLKFRKVIFNDHHLFTESDFKEYDDMNIIMTEKDAIKCKNFAQDNFWCLPIQTDVDEKLLTKLINKLRI